MAKKTIFISYDYDNDSYWKNLLLAWAKNSQFAFTFNDASVDVSVDSTDAAAIKRAISRRINGATRFLCIIGKQTHKSAWVKWEIEKAVELERKLIAVKTNAENTSPNGILGVGASWAMSFTFDAIKKAVDEA